jgi:hypothetical protein
MALAKAGQIWPLVRAIEMDIPGARKHVDAVMAEAKASGSSEKIADAKMLVSTFYVVKGLIKALKAAR